MVRSGEAPEDSIAVMSRQALVGRLAQVKEQFRATSDILKVLTSSSGDPDKVFDAVVENARTLLNAAVAQIYLVKGATYVIARQSGMTEEHRRLLEQHPIKRDRGTLVGRVTIDRRIHHITDAVADPDYSRSDLQRMAGFRSMIGAPLIVGDEVVGALNVMRNRVAPFDDVDERVLATFAEQAALALRHVDLFAALESRSAALESRSAELARKVEQLEGLADVGAAISSTLVPDEMLATIVSHAVELSGTDGGSLMEYDEATGLFRVRTVYGTSDDTVSALRAAEIHIDRTWVGKAARTRRVLQIPDLDEARLDEHLAVLHAAGWKSLVAVPLASPDRVVGVLVVRRKRTGSFSGETCDLLDTFASQSAVALTNARLYQQLELQSADLAEASRHKSEFLASMSHELRTPLNAVIGFSEVLLERMFGDLNERQEDYLKDIHDAGRHLLALLGDILDLSKIEAGRMELDLTTFLGGRRHRPGPLAGARAGGTARHRADARSPAGPRARHRRRAAPQAGAAQPAQQCRQVHAGRGLRRGSRTSRRRRPRRDGHRHGHRHLARGPGPHLRLVPAGQQVCVDDGGHRPRAHARASRSSSCTGARCGCGALSVKAARSASGSRRRWCLRRCETSSGQPTTSRTPDRPWWSSRTTRDRPSSSRFTFAPPDSTL